VVKVPTGEKKNLSHDPIEFAALKKRGPVLRRKALFVKGRAEKGEIKKKERDARPEERKTFGELRDIFSFRVGRGRGRGGKKGQKSDKKKTTDTGRKREDRKLAPLP